jgi:hypothetical protein
VLGLLVVSAASAAAQDVERQSRAFRGLFGRQPQSSDRYRFLDARIAFEGGYDTNLRLGQADVLDPRVRVKGGYGGARAGLVFEQRRRRVEFSASAFGRFRHYATTESFDTSETGGQVGLELALSRHTRVSVDQAAGVFPHFQLNLIPSLFVDDAGLAAQSLDLAATEERTISLFTRVGLTHEFSRRMRMTASGNRRQYMFQDRTGSDSVLVQAGASLLRDLTRHATLRLGYRRFEAEVGGGARRLARDEIDVGVDYLRALSFSRRTSFSFSTGSAILRREGDASSVFRLTGTLRLDHQMGRSWQASALYAHNVGFVEGIQGPVAYDAVLVELGGYLGRRNHLGWQAGYSQGSQNLLSTRQYTTTLGEMTYQLALSTLTALDFRYYYYYYEFDPDFVPTFAFRRTLDRHGVSVGMSLWLPLIR